MNLAASLRPYYASPVAAFVSIPDTKTRYAGDEGLRSATLGRIYHDPTPDQQTGPVKAAVMHHDSSDIRWLVKKTDARGRNYGVFPIAVPQEMQPKMILLEIPDQTEWPTELWVTLDAADSAHMAGGRTTQLGIIRYLERALSAWSLRMDDFDHYFPRLPYGTIIELQKMHVDPAECTIAVVEGSEWTNGNTATELQSIWEMGDGVLPPIVSIEDLQVIKQFTNVVTLVTQISNPSQRLVFKSGFSDVGIYHELKVLLNMPPHQYIEEKPQFLVTLGGESAAKDNVCGFLLKYYEHGSIEDRLAPWNTTNLLWWETPLRWSQQICDSLLHILDQGLFCSDLRMDNILLDRSGEEEHCVLIDLAMDRNIFAWSPPEMLSIEWVAEVVSSKMLSAEQKQEYVRVLGDFASNRHVDMEARKKPSVYENAPVGWWFPWTWSTPKEREAGMVYLLGKA